MLEVIVADMPIHLKCSLMVSAIDFCNCLLVFKLQLDSHKSQDKIKSTFEVVMGGPVLTGRRQIIGGGVVQLK